MDPFASRFVIFRDNSSGKNDEGLTYDLQFGFANLKAENRIDLTSNWKVEFDVEMGAPESYHLDQLTSWTDIDNSGINYYSGSVNYSREFPLSKDALSKGAQAYIVFDDIQEMALVTVNGNDCGIIWTPPYKANITQHLKEGSNNIKVQVINNWNNRIVGDLKNPDGKEYARTNAKKKFSADSPLLESGLIGKAEIFFVN